MESSSLNPIEAICSEVEATSDTTDIGMFTIKSANRTITDAAATTNPPAAITAPHANTSTTIRNATMNTTEAVMSAYIVILSAAKEPSPVMPDLIGHPHTSFLRTSSHHHQEATTS